MLAWIAQLLKQFVGICTKSGGRATGKLNIRATDWIREQPYLAAICITEVGDAATFLDERVVECLSDVVDRSDRQLAGELFEPCAGGIPLESASRISVISSRRVSYPRHAAREPSHPYADR